MEEPRTNAGIVIGPMGVGEIIDAGFNLTRRHFKLLVLVGAYALVPAGILSAIAAVLAPGGFGDAPVGTTDIAWGVVAGILTLASVFLSILAYGWTRARLTGRRSAGCGPRQAGC
jgi:hypothetical protein